jgi:hypothetical protein
LRQLEANVGSGTRLVALQRFQVRPQLQRLLLQGVGTQRRRVAAQLAGDLDRAGIGPPEQRAEAVNRHRQLRIAAADVVLELQRREARSRKLHRRQVSRAHALGVDGDDLVEGRERLARELEAACACWTSMNALCTLSTSVRTVFCSWRSLTPRASRATSMRRSRLSPRSRSTSPRTMPSRGLMLLLKMVASGNMTLAVSTGFGLSDAVSTRASATARL